MTTVENVTVGELLTREMIAKRLGVTPQAVSLWYKTDWFPKPLTRICGSPVWSVAQIEELEKSYIKKSRVFKNKGN